MTKLKVGDIVIDSQNYNIEKVVRISWDIVSTECVENGISYEYDAVSGNCINDGYEHCSIIKYTNIYKYLYDYRKDYFWAHL
jgi:hypothetical protein